MKKQRDERGAVLVLSVAGLVLALIASALAVDLGRQAAEKKQDQAIADLAALDAARELEPIVLSLPIGDLALVIANAEQAAEASAERNGFDPDADGNDIVAEVGSVDDQNVFTAGGSPVNAVKVTASSVIPYIFDLGSRTLSASAIAKLADAGGPGGGGPGGGSGDEAGFDLGSGLASADADAISLPVVNRVFGEMIGGNADIVNWQGLGNAAVSIDALRQELANLGVAAGTPEEMLASDVTLGQVFTAAANALNQQGTSEASAAAALFGGSAGIIAQSTNTTTFKLAEIMAFEQGGGADVANATMKVRNLVVASAQAANGSNVISVPNAGVAVPGVSNTAVTLQIVEPMIHVIGPEGTWGETAQIKLTVTPTINTPLTIAGLSVPQLTGTFPFLVDAAGAKGTVGDIDCGASVLTVGVDTKPATGSGTASLRVTATLPLLGTVPLLDVPTVATMPAIASKHTDLTFANPTEFLTISKQAGTTPLNLVGSDVTMGTPTILSLPITVPQSTVLNAVVAELKQRLGAIETRIVSPLVKRLGLTIGVADVTATDWTCGTTTPPTTTPGSVFTGLRPILVG